MKNATLGRAMIIIACVITALVLVLAFHLANALGINDIPKRKAILSQLELLINQYLPHMRSGMIYWDILTITNGAFSAIQHARRRSVQSPSPSQQTEGGGISRLDGMRFNPSLSCSLPILMALQSFCPSFTQTMMHGTLIAARSKTA